LALGSECKSEEASCGLPAELDAQAFHRPFVTGPVCDYREVPVDEPLANLVGFG
jgi:hypothetical protein